MSNPRHRLDPKDKRETSAHSEASDTAVEAPPEPPEESTLDLSSYPPPVAYSSTDSEDVAAALPAEGAPEQYVPESPEYESTGTGPRQWTEAL